MSNDKKQLQEVTPTPAPKTDISPELQAAINAMGMAVAAGMQAGLQSSRPQPAPQPRARQICTVCRQDVHGCEGKHVEMVVYPTKYPKYARYFTGIQLNGVTYLSNDEGHKVLVPENAASEISAMVARAEQEEVEMRTGREVEHYAGSVSPGGSRPNAAYKGWR